MLRRYCISKIAKLTNSKKAAVAKALNKGSTTNPARQQQIHGSGPYVAITSVRSSEQTWWFMRVTADGNLTSDTQHH